MIRDVAIKRFVPVEQAEEEIKYQRECLLKALWDEGADISLVDKAEVTTKEMPGIMIESRIKNVEIPTLF